MGQGAGMIGKDIEAARQFIGEFRKLIDFNDFPDQVREEFEALTRTATEAKFPGALLVLPRRGKCSVYYAVAADAAEWRRLRPLLMAYAGPTVTSFKGWPESLLPHKIPAEALLNSAQFHVVARLVPGESNKLQTITCRSLQRLVAMVIAAPSTAGAVPETTNRLLARFADCLNGGNYAGAQEILDQCERELRIDALNLLFLRIRLLSWFGNWQAIMEMPELASLLHTRRPLRVTATLLEAVFQTRLRQHGNDVRALTEVWVGELRPEFLPLLQLPILPGCPVGALRLYGLEALSLKSRDTALEAAVLEHGDRIPELAEALVLEGRTGVISEANSASGNDAGLPAVQQALVQAEQCSTLETIGRALQMIETLEACEKERLMSSATFRSLWQSVGAQSRRAPPTSWQEWLGRLSAPDFTEALKVLAHAVEEWPATLLQDPVEIAAFERALQEVPETSPAAERLADGLPSLVTWAMEDPGFPRAGMLQIYDTLLFHLMVGVRRSGIVFESAAVLIRALLTLGLTQNRYRALLDDCLALTGEAVSKRTVYWLLDMLEETLLNPCTDEEARRAFWYAACSRLMQMKAYLSPGQKVVFEKLSTELGWPAVSEGEAVTHTTEEAQQKQLQSALDGRFVAIYTLTESAGRQAAALLQKLAPSVRIEMSHDKGGTTALKNMAHHADIFVMVTASAKHAATGFIQQERHGRPILYANGRGFSTIMRVIEDHVFGSD
jgi:hypothetical protein